MSVSPSFSIRSTRSDRELVFRDPRADYFVVELRGMNAGAMREVYAYTDANGLSKLFSKLAAYDRPWTGAETWESLEGEFKISATCSPLGQVSFSILMCDVFGGWEEWKVSAVLVAEMGQLPGIAQRAEEFFDVVRVGA